MQWRTQVLKKEGARLDKIVKLTDLGLSFTLTKVKFVLKKGVCVCVGGCGCGARIILQGKECHYSVGNCSSEQLKREVQ